MNKENYDFDKIESITQLDNSLVEYGIIRGNNIVVFIKSGLKGTCYGFNNIYLKIAKLLNEKHNCTVICASNPSGYNNDFDTEMKLIAKHADSYNLTDYKIYYFGHSNGAALGIMNAYKYPKISKLCCINGPLMINPHKIISGIKKFDGEKMYLVYGSNDPSFYLVKTFSELESEKIEFVNVNNTDHNFSNANNLFMQLPGVLLFGDEINKIYSL